ncbi:MAG TPA: aldehyde dehydrogenase family protein [Polyangiaceae bacterium]|nr:aldehyde dehydrogenase family protein [Polyangiaceae bacterium]
MSLLPDGALHVASRRFEQGPTAAVRDPWSGDELARVVLADEERAEQATVAAQQAFERWRLRTSHQRKVVLARVAQEVEARAEAFAELIAREAGKPIGMARAEVARAVSTFEMGAEEATRILGEVMPLDVTAASRGYVGAWTRVPAGPVIAVSPFNFPLNLVAHKIAPALACGCSVVLKPPPQAPLTSLWLAECIRKSGADEDTVQVVPCDVGVAERLVRDARFATLSFTGSARVGWHLKGVAGRKRVLLELGGNAAVIVHPDGPVERALDRIVPAAFGYAGQVCIKVQRLYVQRAMADAFVARLVERSRAVRPRPPLDPAAVCSCMIDEANAARVEQWVSEAAHAGARVLCGGRRETNRHWPTVLELDGDGRGLKVVDEEVFGPVLTVHRYDTWDEALAMADATRYGLQAGVFTDSRARIAEAFAKLHVGALVVNDAPTFRVDSMPYGGTRDSGMGREGVRFAIEEMTERKLLVVHEGD